MEYAGGGRAVPHRDAQCSRPVCGHGRLRPIEEVGVDAKIREQSMRQTALLVELLEEAGFVLTAAGPRCPRWHGGVRSPSSSPSTASSRIARSSRLPVPIGLRLGPHFFTTDDELRFAVEQIVEIVETGAARPTSAVAY